MSLPETPSPAKILIIEDEEATRYAQIWALKQGGFKILEASTGREGLELLKESPDLVILDIMLPDMSGFEVCQIIKSNPQTSSIPVLHMSACYSSSKDRIQGLDVGADAYLVHPVEVPELLATVKALLRVRHSETMANNAAKLWESTFNAIRDGVCVVDKDGYILKGNKAFFDVFPERASGLNLTSLIPEFEHIRTLPRSHEVKIDDRWYEVDVNLLDASGQVCTLRDVTQRREAENELLLAKLHAEEANSAKSHFLANMSHEIRTPLGAILGFANLLRERDSTVEEEEIYLETIQRNGSNLTLLIDDILDLSKVEAGKLLFDVTSFDVRQLLEEIKGSLGLQAKSKGLDIDLTIDPSVPRAIVSDPARLRQILMNIMGNAVKFTARGSILVRVHKIAESLVFDVTDTGRGVSKVDSRKLFQAFSQGDATTTREFGGTGLGLVLSKQLAQGLGGDVSLVESRLGEGSTFRVEIALVESDVKVSRGREESVRHRSLTDLKILVVDDSPDNRLLLNRILVRAGAVVAEGENGAEALERAHGFDMVLLDIQMPVMDGYETVQRLRASGYDKPIIALTAHAMNEERDRCLALGCTDYLTKPIDVGLLIGSLSRLRD